jgi:cytochrome c2
MLLKRICWVAFLSFLTVLSLNAAPTVEAGKELFTANCASCHAKNMKEKSTGPALGGLEERWAAFPRTDLYKWIRNSKSMIDAGHPRAVQLWAEYKPTNMTNFPQLKDDDMESLILHINDVYTKAPVIADVVDGGDDKETKESGSAWLYIGIALMLALLAFALMRIINNLGNIARTRDGLAPINKTTWDIVSTKGFVAFTVFAMTLLLGYKTVDNATKLGRTQNYEPTQPIAFSHKLHAGTNKIDCQYCHDSARRSKHSSIPGTNTCMNCHSAVKKGSNSGTAEITKIYASIGFDPNTNTYIPNYENMSDQDIEAIYKKWIGNTYMDGKMTKLDENGLQIVENQWQGIVKALKNDSNGKIQGPIEWTRIHNLADHAYFNHAQHVAVGKVECTKCHGPVEKMEVVYQYSTLGMGWCINCHRETEVKFKDNAYYNQYARYHNELKDKTRDKVTVEDIGGLECQKCHY